MRISKFLAGILCLILIGCGGAEYPPISEPATNEYHRGQVVWYDLLTTQPEVAMNFYTEMFGWNFQEISGTTTPYYVITLNDKPIGGLVKLSEDYGEVAEWVSSFSVPNVKVAVSLNQAKGGKTIYPTANLNGRGETALVRDPQGAFVAYIRSSTGDPEFISEPNNWLWTELWTNDVPGSKTYYTALLSADVESKTDQNRPYFLLKAEGRKIAGMIENPVEGARSAWVPYIRVTNASEACKKAENAGGHLMLKAQEAVRNGTVALIMDPSGAQFAVQEWNIKN